MDIRVNDILVMKSPTPAGKGAGWFCAPARISVCGAWAAAMS